jgi:Predicted membrane protein
MCALQYKNNLCSSKPIPAMAQQCGNWENCMNRDPTIVGRAKVGAELIAEVVNGFVEPISWKTLVRSPSELLASGPDPYECHHYIQGIHIDFSLFSDCFHQCSTFTLPFTATLFPLSLNTSTNIPDCAHQRDFCPSFWGLPLPSAYSKLGSFMEWCK